MSPRELHRAVARATGEFVETIERQGFQLPEVGPSESAGPLVLDWDSGAAARLPELLADEDWPGRVDPLPSYDESFDPDASLEDEECSGVAA